MEFLAHVKPGREGVWETHELGEHLREVARRTTEGSACFALPEWEHLTGLWHDLGKYQPEFQNYIRSVSGFDVSIETVPGRVKHATARVIHATETFTLSFIAENEQAVQRVLAGSYEEP